MCTVMLDMTTQATGQHYRGGFYEGSIGVFGMHSDAGGDLDVQTWGLNLGRKIQTSRVRVRAT